MDRQDQHWWRRIEFPVVLVLVLGVVAAAAGGTVLAGRAVDDFPRNAATDLWPMDGASLDIAYTSGGTTEPGTTEHALLRGYEGLTGIPAGMAGVLYQPHGDPETSHWWRQTQVRFHQLDRRIQLRQATPQGTQLFAQSWGWRGITYGPPVLEVPADVHPGARWESRGEAGYQDGVRREFSEYTNVSQAELPEDQNAAERGCLSVTSRTELPAFDISETSLWCPGEGIVHQQGTWDGQPYRFTPAEAVAISERVRQAAPTPSVWDRDPASWETGWVHPPVEDDPIFGVEQPVVLPTTDPVVGPVGQISVANQFNGDVLTMKPALSDTSQYPSGSAVIQWRSRPGGGDVVAVGVHGELLTVVTTQRQLSLLGSNGARRWTIELSEIAAHAPISLGPDRIAVATRDGRVRMVDVGTGTEIWNTAASSTGIGLPLVTDGRTIAAVDEDYRLLLLNVETGELLSDDVEFGQPVNDLALVDGMVVASAGQVFGVATHQGRVRWRTARSVPQQIEVSGHTVAVTSPHETQLLDATSGQRLKRLPTASSISGVDGGFFALIDNQVELWSTDGELRHEWDLGDVPATALTVGAGRVWAFDRESLSGWWVQP